MFWEKGPLFWQLTVTSYALVWSCSAVSLAAFFFFFAARPDRVACWKRWQFLFRSSVSPLFSQSRGYFHFLTACVSCSSKSIKFRCAAVVFSGRRKESECLHARMLTGTGWNFCLTLTPDVEDLFVSYRPNTYQRRVVLLFVRLFCQCRAALRRRAVSAGVTFHLSVSWPSEMTRLTWHRPGCECVCVWRARIFTLWANESLAVTAAKMPLRYSEQQEKVTSLMILSKTGFNQEPEPIYFLKAFFFFLFLYFFTGTKGVQVKTGIESWSRVGSFLSLVCKKGQTPDLKTCSLFAVWMQWTRLQQLWYLLPGNRQRVISSQLCTHSISPQWFGRQKVQSH